MHSGREKAEGRDAELNQRRHTLELSVAIITKDEAANIGDCLRSLQWATEMIVVDSHSADDTVAIAQDLGARVFDEDWKGYARQKNSAVAKALCPWILSVDADERVTASLRAEIEEIIRDPAALNGYQIPRKNFFCGRWIRYGGWSPDYTLRLFRKGRGNFEERAVHERLTVEGPVGRLASPLLHYTYDT
ncbi:MAG: glycosyltransferase family 2 protein, partial [Desulfatiglandales bacterium]